MSQPVTRVNFFPRQFLRTQDLVAEQEYHLASHRRHQVAGHAWGIVRGLELIVDGDGVFVLSGLGIDGFGRDLVLTERREIPLQAFIQRDTDELEIWLTYGRRTGEAAPPGYADCDQDPSQLPFYRWVERPDVRYTVPDPGFADRRKPRGLSAADLAFDATQAAPDSPDEEWLLYLGLVRRAADAKPPFLVDPTGRPYAGLVGESIVAPSGMAWLEIGVDPSENRDPALAATAGAAAQRFGLYLPGQQDGDPVRIPLSIDESGDTDLRGNVTVDGAVRIIRGELAFDGRADPVTPQPWSMYRASIESGPGATGDELRIDMGATTGVKRVAVGSWSKETGRFMPCLTITDTCLVTVLGDLIVEGRIIRDLRSSADDAIRFDREASTARLTSFESGLSTADGGGPVVERAQMAMRAAPADVGPDGGGGDLVLAAESGTPATWAADAVIAVQGSLAELAADIKRKDPAVVGRLIEALEIAISSP